MLNTPRSPPPLRLSPSRHLAIPFLVDSPISVHVSRRVSFFLWYRDIPTPAVADPAVRDGPHKINSPPPSLSFPSSSRVDRLAKVADVRRSLHLHCHYESAYVVQSMSFLLGWACVGATAWYSTEYRVESGYRRCTTVDARLCIRVHVCHISCTCVFVYVACGANVVDCIIATRGTEREREKGTWGKMGRNDIRAKHPRLLSCALSFARARASLLRPFT